MARPSAEGRKVVSLLKSLALFIHRPVIWVPLITFGLFYVLYFWYIIIHPDALYGGPGDHTAGIIWLYDHSNHTPWWRFTNQTGYPWGENLWTPIFITGQIGYILFWICSKIMGGSVPGYNLFTFIGFALSFGITYGFTYERFLKKPLLVSLLALSITFTPLMFAFDSVGFPSYLFMPAYLFAGFWLVLKIFETKRAVLAAGMLGILGGSTFLFDPYIVLFVPLGVGLFLISLLAMRYYKKFKLTLRDVLYNMITAIISSLPFISLVFYYLHKHSSAIQQVVNNTHAVGGLWDAYYYGARIADYILPGLDNPITPPFLRSIKEHTMHGQSLTSTLYLGVTLIVMVIIAVWWWVRYHKKEPVKDANRKIGAAFLIVAGGAFLFSLPPSFHIFSLTIYTPTWVVATLTPTWRVFSRLQTVVQPALVMVVVCWLSEYMARQKSPQVKKRILWVATLLVFVLLIEYIPRSPFDSSKFWSFSNSLPHVYTTIKSSPHIHVLAEYPMREQPYYKGSLYLTAQHLYNKPTINSYSTTSPNVYIRNAIEDLANPQTLPVLRYLGADTLLVWNTNKDKWAPSSALGLQQLETNTYSSQFGKGDVLKLYHISTDIPARRYLAEIQNNYRPFDETKLTDIHVKMQSGVSIALVDLCEYTHKPKCSTDTTPKYYDADFYNQTNKPIELAFKAFDSGEDLHITLQPGKNSERIKMNSTRYIVNFDESLNDKVAIVNQEIVQ